MNILWIEDFGGLEATESTFKTLFGGLFDKKIFREWDYEEGREAYGAYIDKFVSENTPFHKVVLKLHFPEFKKYFEEENGDINKLIDIVIIDIRLNIVKKTIAKLPTDYANTDDKAIEYFNDHAGFYIFNLLLQSGFPSDNMCLLTGQMGSYERYEEDCERLYLNKPCAFEKSPNGYGHIKEWIETKRQSKRMQLKRGILEGLDECRKHLSEPFLFLSHFRDDEEKKYEREEITKIYIENYLNAIESSINDRDFNRNQSLTLLVRSITHEWDIKMNTYKKPYVFILKKIRNMVAHGNKLEIWNEQDAAILFLICMRQVVNYRTSKLFPYEEKLLSIVRGGEKQKWTPKLGQHDKCIFC